jgi:uroporphyrinogen decarboxylase
MNESPLANDNLIRAFFRQPTTRTPVWMMRQAGRYLPEYRALRQQQSNFIKFCQTPELCCEATLQPLARFDLDAAIIFSDILTIPHAMGMDLEFIPGRGPVFANPLRSMDDIKALAPVGASELGYVMRAIETTQQALAGRVPLIGFSGSPWTLACYMVEGGGSKAWPLVKRCAYQSPDIMHALLDQLTSAIIRYLNGQVEAGADALMVFDTWGGVLSYAAYGEFSLRYLKRISDEVTRERNGQKIPLVFFTKHASPWLEQLAGSGCDAVGLDFLIDIHDAKRRIGDQVALQGNLDPFVLMGGQELIDREVKRILSAYQGDTGYVFNLGHGIDKDTPIEGVEWMLQSLRAVDQQYREGHK